MSPRAVRSGLYRKIVFPVTGIMVILVLLLSILSSAYIISIQNEQTVKSVTQSMSYVYRNLWYQFNSLKNITGFVISNQEIENLMGKHYEDKLDAVGDYYNLYNDFQNISLMSLLNDIDPHSQAQISYIISLFVHPGSNFYDLATAQFATAEGIYKSDGILNEPWFQKLEQQNNAMVWWTGTKNASDYIYAAKRKLSIKDGKELGIVVVAYDIHNFKGILDQSGLENGTYVLADENNRVIFSNAYTYGFDLSKEPYILRMNGETQGFFNQKLAKEHDYVAFHSYDNGWKLISLVPESHVKDYTFIVAGIALLVSTVGLWITHFFIKRVAAKVSLPIIKLAATMKQVEIGQFVPSDHSARSSIVEVELLYRGYSYMIRRVNELIEEVYVKDITQKQMELDLLQAQINPHFMYNTLDIINCKAIFIGDEEISLVARSLANVLRYGLNKGQSFIALGDELKQVSSYLEIQKLMHEHLTYTIQADASLLQARVIHFILQPLVENSILHGFRNKRIDCRIAITVRSEAEKIFIDVVDNGSGMDANKLNEMLSGLENEAERGFGTRNVNRRIKLHCGEEFGITYISCDNGSWVQVNLPADLDC